MRRRLRLCGCSCETSLVERTRAAAKPRTHSKNFPSGGPAQDSIWACSLAERISDAASTGKTMNRRSLMRMVFLLMVLLETKPTRAVLQRLGGTMTVRRHRRLRCAVLFPPERQREGRRLGARRQLEARELEQQREGRHGVGVALVDVEPVALVAYRGVRGRRRLLGVRGADAEQAAHHLAPVERPAVALA